MSSPTELALLELLAQAGEGRSITPEAVARAVEPQAWRSRLTEVRSVAVGLARQGRIVILRHGKPTDPNAFKGVYRLAAAPRNLEPAA